MRITDKHRPETKRDWSVFVIWSPRYHDKHVLLMDKKIRQHNKIKFTRDKHLKDRDFYISQNKARKYPTKMMANKEGGYSKMREIPLKDLEDLIYWGDIWKKNG